MSGTDVKIDRLVLDIPGLDAVAAQRLAAGIGAKLAEKTLSGKYPRIDITLEPGSEEDLAARIAAALMARL
jgi:hypothetical protein